MWACHLLLLLLKGRQSGVHATPCGWSARNLLWATARHAVHSISSSGALCKGPGARLLCTLCLVIRPQKPHQETVNGV
jgi:hypothetical protein